MPIEPQTVTREQQIALRELAALSTIPAAWAIREPPAIVAGLADVLVGSLGLDFAFVRMHDPQGGAPIEVTRGHASKPVPEWLRTHLGDVSQFSRKEIVTDLGGAEPCRGVVIPIGVNSERGVIAAACSRSDFPNEIDHLLLSVTANHAATAFQNARLRAELDAKVAQLHQARNELEIKVVERTAELTTANEELHRQKEQLDRLFELSPVAVILTDQNFRVLRVNQEFTRMFGYRPEEALGQSLYEMVVPEELQEDAVKNMALVRSGERLNLESVRRRKDGSRLDVSIMIAPLSLGSGETAIYLIYRDITERKKAERKLRRSEATLLEGQRLVHMGSWAHHPSSPMVTCSPEMKRIYEIESDQDPCPIDLFTETFHPEDRPVLEEIRKAQLDKRDYDASYRIVLPDGSIKHIYSVGHPILEESGELLEYVGTSMDVTEQRKARTELEKAFEEIKQRTEAARRSERELRSVVNTVPAHVWSTSPEGDVDFVNDRWLQFTGFVSKEAFEGKWEGVVHPDDRARVVADWQTAIKNGQAMECEARVRRADGEYCWWFIRNVPLRDESGKLVKWYGTAIDIEDRKQAEQALRKSEERWRSVFENSAIGVSLTDPDGGRFLATNHVYQKLLGYTEEELRALSFLDVTHEDYREANWALDTELLEGKRQQFQMEKQYVRKDGSLIWASINVSLVPGTESVPRFFMALSEDITERKRAEEALRRSEAYLAEGQRLAKSGSWAVNPNTERPIYWSEEMRRIFGLDPQRSSLPDGEEFLRLVHPEDRAGLKERVDQAVRAKTDITVDYRIVLPDGTIKHIHGIGHPVLDETGKVIEYVGTDVDITERKRVEQRLRGSEADLNEAQRISQTGSWKHHVSSGTVTVSPEVFRIFGVTPDEDTSAREFWLNRNHPEDQKRIQELFERSEIEKTDYVADYRIVLPNGSIKHLHAIGHPVLSESGELVEFIGTVMDITQRKLAEEALRRSEGYLAEAQRLTHTGSWAWNLRTGTRFWSQETFRIYNYDPQKVGPTWEQFLERVHPDDRPQIEQRAKMEPSQKDWVDSQTDFRIVLPEGTIKHLHSVARPVRDESGETIEVVGTVMDVTEQHEARAALQRAFEQIKAEETELRRMADAIASYIYVLRPDGTPLYANRTALDYAGIGLHDLQREDHRVRVFHPEDVERLREERKQALARGVPFENEQRALGKDGKYRWFLVRYNPLRDDEGNIIRWYATGTDIDERKQAEERMRDENLALREQIDQAFMFEEIVGSSAALQTVLSGIVKVAPTDSTVLITGETGTGKELIARAIHKHSQRSGQAFISVNCASIPSSLIASELFGHEKGAFTGAVQRRQGRFELAHSGTIFLDEVGDLPAEAQVALLRVLQERQFERVGGNRILTTDVRVIAATNRDLTAAIAAGTFRPDLFYRLNVFPIEVPPVRKRKEDISILLEYFVKRYAEKTGKQIRRIDRNTLELCQSYPWPGNIRELQNIVERSVILSSGDTFRIEKAWLVCPDPRRDELSGPLPDTLQNQEREIIETALAESKGKVAGPEGAAAKLGIPRSTLDSKIKQLKIKKHKFVSEEE